VCIEFDAQPLGKGVKNLAWWLFSGRVVIQVCIVRYTRDCTALSSVPAIR
jgi:hypothetical protein